MQGSFYNFLRSMSLFTSLSFDDYIIQYYLDLFKDHYVHKHMFANINPVCVSHTRTQVHNVLNINPVCVSHTRTRVHNVPK